MAYCRKKGIQMTAYSPLTQTKKFGNAKLQAIAKKHGVTPA